MAGTESEVFFKGISDAKERTQIFDSLLATKAEILCKLPPEQIVKLTLKILGKGNLFCHGSFDASKVPSPCEVICNFSLAGEKYFFTSQAVVRSRDQEIEISTPNKIYLLQRRQNYRLKIPDSYDASIEIESVNQSSAKKIGKLYDLSVGGCKAGFDIQDLTFKMDDEISGKLHIKNRDSIAFKGAIRHLQGNTAGIEFTPFTPALESRLFSLTMDLHKEFFSSLR